MLTLHHLVRQAESNKLAIFCWAKPVVFCLAITFLFHDFGHFELKDGYHHALLLLDYTTLLWGRCIRHTSPPASSDMHFIFYCPDSSHVSVDTFHPSLLWSSIGSVSISYNIAGWTILLWIFPLTFGGIVMSHGTPKSSSSCLIHTVSSCSHMYSCIHCSAGFSPDIWIRWPVTAGTLPIHISYWHSIQTCVLCLCSWYICSTLFPNADLHSSSSTFSTSFSLAHHTIL